MMSSCVQSFHAPSQASDPPAGSGANEYHRLEVRVARHGLTARTREGYYARPVMGWQPIAPKSIQSLDQGRAQ